MWGEYPTSSVARIEGVRAAGMGDDGVQGAPAGVEGKGGGVKLHEVDDHAVGDTPTAQMVQMIMLWASL